MKLHLLSNWANARTPVFSLGLDESADAVPVLYEVLHVSIALVVCCVLCIGKVPRYSLKSTSYYSVGR